MQWDHLPGFDKVGDLSGSVWAGSTEAEILSEIAKCELVCTNCHIIRTFARNGWDKRSLHEDQGEYGQPWMQIGA
jgi:hypothetical protein